MHPGTYALELNALEAAALREILHDPETYAPLLWINDDELPETAREYQHPHRAQRLQALRQVAAILATLTALPPEDWCPQCRGTGDMGGPDDALECDYMEGDGRDPYCVAGRLVDPVTGTDDATMGNAAPGRRYPDRVRHPEPCGDCGRAIDYDYSDEQYHHAEAPARGCFLIPAEPTEETTTEGAPE